MSERFQALVGPATSRAEAELARLGFIKEESGKWRGQIGGRGEQTATIIVELPNSFPARLPKVSLPRGHSLLAQAHVERDGQLCVATHSGTLIDVERPEAVVREVLDRAEGILFPKNPAAQNDDLTREFMAYWPELKAGEVYSICESSGAAREIAVVELRPRPARRLLAPTLEDAQKWARKIGCEAGSSSRGFFLPLQSLFRPPPFDELISLRKFRAVLREHTSQGDFEAFTKWLRANGVPGVIALSAPLSEGEGRVLFAASLPGPTDDQMWHAQHGFRPGRVPKALLVCRAHSRPITRHSVERFDPEYLLHRGGGRPALLSRRAVVVGVGSVGSHVAIGLAAAGVGALHLIDDDILTSGNVQRHVLGASHVGQSKVDGMADVIGHRFPHVDVTSDGRNVLDLMASDPGALSGWDIAIFALGEETVERALTAVLSHSLPRVHVWLEPRGLGGHVLLSGVSGQGGCFECLFRRDEALGLLNMASLVAPGQIFQKTLGACSGTFTPYGMGDAERAATEAVRVACGVLLQRESSALLHSWVNTASSFTGDGFLLSARGETIAPGSGLTVRDWARADCPLCGGEKR